MYTPIHRRLLLLAMRLLLCAALHGAMACFEYSGIYPRTGGGAGSLYELALSNKVEAFVKVCGCHVCERPLCGRHCHATVSVLCVRLQAAFIPAADTTNATLYSLHEAGNTALANVCSCPAITAVDSAHLRRRCRGLN